MADVVFTMTTDEKDVQAALQRLTREMTKLRDQNNQLRESTKKGSQESTSFFQQGAMGLAKMVAGYMSVHAAMQLVTSEMEKQRGLDEKARFEQASLAEVIRGTKLAFQPDATLRAEDLEQTILDVGQRTRTDPKAVAAALQDAFSARGDMSNEVAVDAVEQAFRLKPGDTELARTLSAFALDVAKVTGDTDMRKAIGFITQMQQNARVTDPVQAGKNLVPAVASLVQQGDSVEEAAELTAAFTQLAQDPTGEKARTAVISLGEQLGEFVPDKQAKDERGKFAIPAEQREDFAGATDTTERIAVMQQSPELRRAFLATASFERATAAASRRILSGEEGALKALEQARTGVTDPTGAGMAQFFEAQIDFLDKEGRFQAPLTAEQQTRENIRASQLRDIEGQREATARNTLTSTIDSVDLPGFDALVGRSIATQFDIKTRLTDLPPERIAIEQLESLLEEETSPTGFVTRNAVSNAEERTRIIQAIEQLEGILRDQQAAQERARANSPESPPPQQQESREDRQRQIAVNERTNQLLEQQNGILRDGRRAAAADAANTRHTE